MGRHGISQVGARQRLPAGHPARGAAKYVGRVGALAFALGIGAAVVGGAGLANADGASDKDSGSATSSDGATGSGAAGGGAPSASGSVATPSESVAESGTDVDPSTAASPGAKASKPESTTVPKMVFDGGVPKHRPLAAADADRSSPAKPNDTTTGTASAATPDEPAVHSKNPDAHQGHRSNGDDAVAPQARPKAADDTAAVVRTTASPAADPASVASLTASVPAALPVQPAPVVAHPIVTLVADALNAINVTLSTITTGWPLGPIHLVVAALQLIHREIDHFVVNLHAAADFYSSAQPHVPPATAATAPAPDDATQTAYGDIGKWMLESNGQISDYGGQPYQGKTLLEAVNVVILDPNSTSPEQAAARLNTAMFWSGFPAQPIHSTGFAGEIDDVIYGQQPTGLLEGYSDNLFILPNDHGRIFGPDPVQTSTGYVWSGAFSTEALTIYGLLPAHAYVSSTMARTALATRLILSGQATYVGMVPLDNAVDDATTTTGDHDGYAVVLRLT